MTHTVQIRVTYRRRGLRLRLRDDREPDDDPLRDREREDDGVRFLPDAAAGTGAAGLAAAGLRDLQSSSPMCNSSSR